MSSLQEALARRIVILDGAMGTMIQGLGLDEAAFRGAQYKSHARSLKGCNDLLVVTQPDAITNIHLAFLNAGADIIETNTFTSTGLAMADYGLESEIRRINLAAAQCARDAVARAKRGWVAGSIGPTTKTASLSPDVNDPGFRAVTFDELVATFKEQAHALIDGGVDLLLTETHIDTLNMKAALFAIQSLFDEGVRKVPVIASVTIPDRSGRTLSGQTIAAFHASIAHFDLLAVGINCALGADDMRPHVEELSRLSGGYVHCYPNAGLPNEFGGYDDTPEHMAKLLGGFARAGWLNLVGGCCGTRPEHIAAIAEAVKDAKPRAPSPRPRALRLSGLEPLEIGEAAPFVVIGERTNVTGSAAFRRLIKDDKYEEAVSVARQQVEGGANILDVCMDEGMLDGVAAMTRFLNLIASEPDIAKIPVMIDSSRWEIIEAGLKCLQGKGVVNSISLKEGEDKFRAQARLIRRYGAAAVVMAFDETGQATTVEHKLSISKRAYHILVDELGFPPEDVIFDPNILTVATGIEEHDEYAVNFIEATRRIKAELPYARVSGGVSNISFSFRTNLPVREAMHAAFLYHAIRAGLDMAIVNAGQLAVYEEIEPTLKQAVEDVLLARRADATERLVELASTIQAGTGGPKKDELAWRKLPLRERMAHALVIGNADFTNEDVAEALTVYPRPLSIIEGPLMDGMNIVGELFGAGKMFLPQVVKSARVMKKAVAILEPLMDAEKKASGVSTAKGKMVIATVKGDVHDIGKNIVAVVLRCNGYDVTDLGVMVPVTTILDTAKAQQADIIGLSGLITPSLDEMIGVAREMERRGLTTPLLIGGATTSGKHTAVKIAPSYTSPTVHVPDASLAVGVMNRLLGSEKVTYVEEVRAKQAQVREAHASAMGKRTLLSYADAKARKHRLDAVVNKPEQLGVHEVSITLDELVPWIDWSPLFHTWELSGRYPKLLDDPVKGDAARKLYADARKLLDKIVADKLLQPRGVYGIWPAHGDGEDLVIDKTRFPMLRQQEDKDVCLSLADFVAPQDDHVGGFIVTAGHGQDELVAHFERDHDDYHSIMTKALADRLAEAFAEVLHKRVRDLWGYGKAETFSHDDILAERYRGIRPAFGYPACPDHQPKEALFTLLDHASHHGVRLTESMAMLPTASVSGLYFGQPDAKYFSVGRVGKDQVEDYARRMGTSVTAVERMIPSNLAY